MTDLPRRPRLGFGSALVAGAAVAAVVAGVLLVRLLPGEDSTALPLPPGVPLVVFAEFGPSADHVYAAPANDPAQRTLVERIEHAPGWGINPAPAMTGTRFAYTVLPPGAASRQDSPAELWVVDVRTQERTRLARDADLLVAPFFADGGSALVYRRSNGGQQEIVRVDLESSTRRVVHAERTSFGIFPIGYGADGSLVYARLSTAGTDVLSVREGRAPMLLFHASDHIARDWQIAPDGQHIAYLAVEEALERILHRAQVSRLASGEPLPLERIESTDGEQYSPTWTEDGGALAVGRQASPDEPGGVLVQTLDGRLRRMPAPERGFDVPIAWSPDGRYLAARTYSGIDSHEPGDESYVILDAEGTRHPIDVDAELIFIGWIARA